MEEKKELRSFLVPRDPSIDRRFRPKPKTQLNLLNIINDIDEENYEDESTNFENENTSDQSSDKSLSNENALVYLRMKPVLNPQPFSYIVTDNVLVTNHIKTNTANVQSSVEKHFTFNNIFTESVSQAEIFANCIQDKIEAENNFTVMTYGTSGSGKTFTLLGTPDEPGIIPRSLENIFIKYSKNLYSVPSALIKNGEIMISNDKYFQECKYLRKNLLDSKSEFKKDYEKAISKIRQDNIIAEQPRKNESVLIYCSFIEIYNEVVHDLLNPKIGNNDGNRKSGLKIMMNDGKVFVKDITSVFVKNGFEAYQLLWNGLKKVTYASTGINSNSSRSHCIFMVDIIKYNSSNIFTYISFKFCDLAGSERLGKSGNKGTRLKEAQQINKSLMVLGRCLDAAYNNQNKKCVEIIPYRESKLTMLLQAPLQGKEKIMLFVNISPTEEYFEENINVLSFSSIARNIVYKPVEEKRKQIRFSFLTHTMEQSYSNEEFEKLWEENCTLRSEIETLSNNVEKLETESLKQELALRKEIVNHFEADIQKRKIRWEEKLQNTERTLKKFYEEKIEALKNMNERKLKRAQEDLEMLEEEYARYKSQIENENYSGTNSNKSAKKMRITLNTLEDYQNLKSES